MGVKEAQEHDLLSPYPVLVEKQGDFTAHFKCTIAIQPKSTVILSGKDFDESILACEKDVVNEEIKELLKGDLWKKEVPKKEAKKWWNYS